MGVKYHPGRQNHRGKEPDRPDEEEWKVEDDGSIQHQRINHTCDLQVLMKDEGKSLGPCTADQGQINTLWAGGLMQLNNTQQVSPGLSLNLD